MTTIKEIAQKSGFSPSTVSRLLSNDSTLSVSKETRNKILNVAKNLNYYQDPYPKKALYRFAIIFSIHPQREIEDIYYHDLRKALLTNAEMSHLELSFFQNLKQVEADFDGCIAIGFFENEELTNLREKFKYVVFIDSNPDPEFFSSVQPNLEYATFKSIDLFIEASTTKIGLVAGKFWSTSVISHLRSDVREQYFESHMREHNIFEKDLVFIADDFTVQSGYNIGKKIIATTYSETFPSALLVGSDSLAVGLLRAFNEQKINVPVDVKDISINDSDISAYTQPTLTTWHIDLNELAHSGLDTLYEMVAFHKITPKIILLNPKLVYRESFLQK